MVDYSNFYSQTKTNIPFLDRLPSMVKILFFLIAFLTLHSLPAISQIQSTSSPKSSEQSPRFAIHLLDYLAHDYGGSVANGKVISASEYAEQKEFLEKIIELAGTLPEIKNDKNIADKILKLKSLIESKAEAFDVTLKARDIQKDLISITKISLTPTSWPSLSNGKVLFGQNCISCHGQNGFGDGPNAKGLEPAPANFHHSDRMSSISAFHSYNTIRLGVPGTGMAAWSNFSDKEVWDLSFYIMSLRHTKLASTAKAEMNFNINKFSLLEVATLSDTELKEKFNKIDDDKRNLALALLRTKNDNTSGDQFIGIAKSYLNQAQTAFKNNSKDDAKRLAIQAYLEGIEPIEPTLKLNNPKLVARIEKEMGLVRKIIADPKATSSELDAQIIATQNVFTEAEDVIHGKELSFGVAFSGSFAIILREGFEAVLIILTLLSVIKAFGNRKAALWVHAGWASALFLGFVAWLLSGLIMQMSGARREVLEAVTSSFAVVILLYFGFWLHRQTEISRWKNFIQEKVQGAINNKNLLGLFSIAFLSVFREAFETVLFIRALWFQTNSDGKNAIGLGLFTALALIFSFSYIALRYSKKLPIRELFKVSSILTSILAFILAGKAIHSMQEAGLLESTGIPWNFRFETIGLFPTWQTIAGQILTLVLAVAMVNYNTKTSKVRKTT